MNLRWQASALRSILKKLALENKLACGARPQDEADAVGDVCCCDVTESNPRAFLKKLKTLSCSSNSSAEKTTVSSCLCR
jgi:hypothetical protein